MVSTISRCWTATELVDPGEVAHRSHAYGRGPETPLERVVAPANVARPADAGAVRSAITMGDEQTLPRDIIAEVRALLPSLDWFPEQVVGEADVERGEWLQNVPYELYLELFGEQDGPNRPCD
jgi:hypothetical protein